MLELATVKKLVPKTQRSLLSQDFLDKIEASVKDTAIAEEFKDNFITYLNVLSKGKYKMEDYIAAVKYISFKLLGYSNIDAYAATFPERYEEHLADGKTLDALRARADGFSRTKLVQSILERGYIAPYLLNQPLFQQALNTAASIMLDDSVSAMARVNAAKTVLEYTKAPEVQKLQMEVGIKASDELSQLEDTMNKLADVVYTGIQTGKLTSKEAIESTIIEVEAEDCE